MYTVFASIPSSFLCDMTPSRDEPSLALYYHILFCQNRPLDYHQASTFGYRDSLVHLVIPKCLRTPYPTSFVQIFLASMAQVDWSKVSPKSHPSHNQASYTISLQHLHPQHLQQEDTSICFCP